MTRLDPQARSLLEAMNAAGQPPLFTLPAPAARRARRRQLVVDPPRVHTANVQDDLVPGPLGGIPLRWYRPSPRGGLPVTLYLHGGGWTVDDLDTTTISAAAWPADRGRSWSRWPTGGPEHPYPAAVEDAYAAAQWVVAVGRERGVDRADPYVFPLRAADLSGLPAALIVTAEFDPLRDEGRAYAQRLRAAGVAVEHVHLDDQLHGFLLQEATVDRTRAAALSRRDGYRGPSTCR